MKNLQWDDIRCFLAVARSGGLSQAAPQVGASAATLGRRMLSLERQLMRKLFVRRQTGYQLTNDGKDFLAIALAMDAGSRQINFWLDAELQKPVVRLSAGTWTSSFLCENFARIWTPDDPFILAFHTTEARLDISHREVTFRTARLISASEAANPPSQVWRRARPDRWRMQLSGRATHRLHRMPSGSQSSVNRPSPLRRNGPRPNHHWRLWPTPAHHERFTI